MSTLVYETEEAAFEFDLALAIDRLIWHANEYAIAEARELLTFIAASLEPHVRIPDQHSYFGFVALDLIDNHHGIIRCKTCDRIYGPDDLKPVVVGQGTSPFSVQIRRKGWIRRIFGRSQKLPGMFGGKGYECPQRHSVISKITWIT